MPGAFITFTYPSTRVLFLSEVRGACQRQGCLISKMRGQCPPPTLRRWRHDWMAKKGIVRSALHRPCVGGGTTGWLKKGDRAQCPPPTLCRWRYDWMAKKGDRAQCPPPTLCRWRYDWMAKKGDRAQCPPPTLCRWRHDWMRDPRGCGSRFQNAAAVYRLVYRPVRATGWPGMALRGSFLSRIAVL